MTSLCYMKTYLKSTNRAMEMVCLVKAFTCKSHDLIVNHQVRMLGTELRSSARVVSVINHRVVSSPMEAFSLLK